MFLFLMSNYLFIFFFLQGNNMSRMLSDYQWGSKKSTCYMTIFFNSLEKFLA